MKKDNKDIMYIYDVNKCNFYLSNNILPLEMGVNHKTGKSFLVFDKESTDDLYQLWAERSKMLNKF